MYAGHRVNDMAVVMRAQHLLHPVAGAKSQIACSVKFTVSPAQKGLRRFVTVVPLHHWEPIEEESRQRQAMSLGCFSGSVTQPAFCQRKNHMRFEMLYCLFQRSVGCHWTDQIFV